MRYFWKGNISFGLINIPVGLVKATEEHELQFKLLHKKDLSEIRYAKICKAEDKEVPFSEIVKGIEKNGRLAVLSEEDFKKAEKEKSRTIEIVTFCDEDDIHSLYYERPYFIKPEKEGEKAYALLCHALAERNKVAVVLYSFKNHAHIAAIKPFQHVLVLNQMRFSSQIKNIDDLAINDDVKVSKAEGEMAMKLIDQLSGPFKADTFADTYVTDLQKTISKKATIGVASKKTAKPKSAKIYDLMGLLKASLDEPAKKRVARPRKTSPQKKKRA